MIVYHGTSFLRFKKIIKEGVIHVKTDALSHYNSHSDYARTTNGYAYLTDNPFAALEFGLKCWVNENYKKANTKPHIGIFELDISDGLEHDEDEERYDNSSVTVGKKAQYYRTKQSISINSSCLRYTSLSFQNQENCYKYIDSFGPDYIDYDSSIKWNIMDGNWENNSSIQIDI